MPAQVFTLGYSGLPWRVFEATCAAAGVTTLVDIRTIPSSRQDEYDGDQLPQRLAALGIDYVALPELGDLEADVEADAASFERAVRRVQELTSKGALLVLCHEPSPRQCRRAALGERLNGLGTSVAHLEPAGRLAR